MRIRTGVYIDHRNAVVEGRLGNLPEYLRAKAVIWRGVREALLGGKTVEVALEETEAEASRAAEGDQ